MAAAGEERSGVEAAHQDDSAKAMRPPLRAPPARTDSQTRPATGEAPRSTRYDRRVAAMPNGLASLELMEADFAPFSEPMAPTGAC